MWMAQSAGSGPSVQAKRDAKHGGPLCGGTFMMGPDMNRGLIRVTRTALGRAARYCFRRSEGLGGRAAFCRSSQSKPARPIRSD